MVNKTNIVFFSYPNKCCLSLIFIYRQYSFKKYLLITHKRLPAIFLSTVRWNFTRPRWTPSAVKPCVTRHDQHDRCPRRKTSYFRDNFYSPHSRHERTTPAQQIIIIIIVIIIITGQCRFNIGHGGPLTRARFTVDCNTSRVCVWT